MCVCVGGVIQRLVPVVMEGNLDRGEHVHGADPVTSVSPVTPVGCLVKDHDCRDARTLGGICMTRRGSQLTGLSCCAGRILDVTCVNVPMLTDSPMTLSGRAAIAALQVEAPWARRTTGRCRVDSVLSIGLVWLCRCPDLRLWPESRLSSY